MSDFEKNRSSYNIFKIVNNKPGDKEKKKYFFVTGVYDDPDKVKTRLRGIAKSKAVRGGAKLVSGDMAKDGDDYDRHFDVSLVAKGLSKTRALELRNKLKTKTPPKKVYNKPR